MNSVTLLKMQKLCVPMLLSFGLFCASVEARATSEVEHCPCWARAQGVELCDVK